MYEYVFFSLLIFTEKNKKKIKWINKKKKMFPPPPVEKHLLAQPRVLQ
jgi:hypothetical protein